MRVLDNIQCVGKRRPPEIKTNYASNCSGHSPTRHMGASRRPQSHQNPEESRAHHQPSSDLRDKAEALTYCYVDMLQPWPQGKLYLARLHLSVCVFHAGCCSTYRSFSRHSCRKVCQLRTAASAKACRLHKIRAHCQIQHANQLPCAK